jgi:hypothetical protein
MQNPNYLFKLLKWALTVSLILFVLIQGPDASSVSTIEIATEDQTTISFSKNIGISNELLAKLNNKMSKFKGLINKNIITVIDFTLPGTEKRLWTIDLNTGKVILNSLVAHGKNSGENMAEKFSNKPESHQSSLGFYLTENAYSGKHGYSMRLIGLEKNINDKAYDRAIVVHSADYVSEDFIKQHGRLGRSFGCPALPVEVNDTFIDVVKDGSLLFIYHDSYQ